MHTYDSVTPASPASPPDWHDDQSHLVRALLLDLLHNAPPIIVFCFTSQEHSCIFAVVRALSLSLLHKSDQSPALPAFIACRIVVLSRSIPLFRAVSLICTTTLRTSCPPVAPLSPPRPSSLLPACLTFPHHGLPSAMAYLRFVISVSFKL